LRQPFAACDRIVIGASSIAAAEILAEASNLRLHSFYNPASRILPSCDCKIRPKLSAALANKILNIAETSRDQYDLIRGAQCST
jgi:hypothetical protein